MSLSEKITALRTGLKLSQEDVAEKLGVSRQSVSKWETAQSMPDLEKIIKLADLFGVTVDELVRDGDEPGQEEAEPAPAPPPPGAEEPRVVYVERRLAPTQILGAALLVLGLLGVLLGLAVGNSGVFVSLIGAGMVVLGLPLLLSRKHPFLAAGWVALAVSCLILNPYTSVSPWGLVGGIWNLYLYLTAPELHYATILFAALVGIIRGTLFLAVLIFTLRAALWRRKGRETHKI